MFEKQALFYTFLFTFMQLIRITHLTFHDSGHGFMTKKSRYFDDELSHIHEVKTLETTIHSILDKYFGIFQEIGSLRYFQNVDSLDNLNLRFDPEVLDFRERSLGTPHSRIVTLFNTDSNKTVDLSSISGNTVHFHSSFFEDKQIPPNGNTTFKVVYLGRHEGPVESSLFLHTSNGFVKYNVKAFGTFNSYKVRPIVGVKLPVNSTFTPVIYMHNPHSQAIQIVEILSSGGGFHLELPGGQHEGLNGLWEINPYETKAVIRIRFDAKIPHNHTAYIRIKLHDPEEISIVPLEVEVTEVQNVFHPQGYVDFGIAGSLDEPKEVNLCLHNPLKRAVRVHSVSTLSKSIKIHYYNIRINPPGEDENKCVNVETLTLDWKNAWQFEDYHGQIIVKLQGRKNRTEIPYFLTVLKGGLSYDKMSTTYFLIEQEMDTNERNFEVVNHFHLPVQIVDVKFPFDMDKVQTLTPLTVHPLEKKSLFNIWLKPTAKKTDMQLTSHIKILTNVSEMNVPLLSYNGKLQIHLPYPSDGRSLNIGLIGHHKKMELVFSLNNPNPVELALLHLTTSLATSEFELFGCGVAAQGYAVVKMTINTNDDDGYVKGDIHIQTVYENLSFPVSYKVAAGEMIIDRDDLLFDNCFPGKTCTHPLRVFSSFSQKMSVENILTLPPDGRVFAAITSNILPKVNRIIGYMYFNPESNCGPNCYTGFISEGSASWLRTLVITKQVSEYDMKLASTFYGRFLNFTENGAKTRNISLRLDTSGVKGQIFVSKINYTWPKLVRQTSVINSTLEFPLTQVRNSSHKTLILQNPANHSIVVQLIFENDYPHAEMLYDGLPSSFIPPSDIKYTSANWFSFDKRVMENQQKHFVENLRINVYKQSLPLILMPGQSKRVNLDFTAEEARPYSSLLLIRNNLTILEVVRLNGKGTIPRFEFATLQPGDQKPLQFELSEKHMRPCNLDLNQNPFLPNLTIIESFAAKNLGEIPVHVTSFFINGYSCVGFGFKASVINCEPFMLSPNTSRKIDLAFTPDLTLHEISRVLIIGTSLNTFVNYSLKATVSRHYCRFCSALLDRPSWEIVMSYIVNVFLTVMLLLVFAIALLDANTAKAKALAIYMVSNTPPMLPVLDLRQIGRQVRVEFQTSLKEKVKTEYAPEAKEVENTKSEPAIIPTTGRAKRKLCQKSSLNERENSVEDELERERVRERQKKKDILFERHRLKSRERKTEKELKLLGEKGKKDKHAQQKEVDLKKSAAPKKQCKVIQVQEGESSSTTTESSNSSMNCDEVDKENQRLNWPKQKVNVSSQTVNDVINSKEAQDSKIKHVSFVNSKLSIKANKPAGGEQEKEQESPAKGTDSKSTFIHNISREKRRREPKFKERKDKLIFRHKSHNERKQFVMENEPAPEPEAPKAPGFFVALPTAPPSCPGWSENKARFSDVVARSEPPSAPSPVSTQSSESPSIYPQEEPCFAQSISPFKQNKPCTKPTMYVEPYKPIDLGPIGSRRMGTPDSMSPDLFNHEGAQYLPPSRQVQPPEFYPINDTSVIAAVANNTFMTGANRSPPGFFSHQLQNVPSEEQAIGWPRQQLFRDTSIPPDETIRTNLFSPPALEDDSWRGGPALSTSPPANRGYWSNTFSSVLNSTSKLANNASYLWGSHSIWTPHTQSPNRVRRTPPGFDEQIQKKKRTEEEQKPYQQQQKQAGPFNPFTSGGSGSPWSQHWE
ncbi:hypothetical protein HUJ04_010605 [Dendroctonus ponderosae]|nr:hypothetical protein HUJ04_010605 [Dendroctonus ponderosae]